MTSKVISIATQDKTVKEFTVHKYPTLEGRDIVLAYPFSVVTQSAGLEKNTAAMRKLMRHVSVGDVFLTSDELINEHVGDWFELVQLEFQSLKFNCSFLAELEMVDVMKGALQQYIANVILAGGKANVHPSNQQVQ